MKKILLCCLVIVFNVPDVFSISVSLSVVYDPNDVFWVDCTNENIYTYSVDGSLYKRDTTGNVLNKAVIPSYRNPLNIGIAKSSNFLVFAFPNNIDGNIYLFKTTDLERIHEFRVNDPTTISGIGIADDTPLYFCKTSSGDYLCYDLKVGSLLWKKRQNMVIDKREYVVDNALIIVEYSKNRLTARDVDKKILWEIETNDFAHSHENRGINASNTRDCFFSKDGTSLSVLSIQTGKQVWSYDYSDTYTLIAYNHGTQKMLIQQDTGVFIQQIGCEEKVPIAIDPKEYSCFFSSDGEYLCCIPKRQWLQQDERTVHVKRKDNILRFFNSETGKYINNIDLTMSRIIR